MIVGHEWVVDASGCDPGALRDLALVQRVIGRIVAELGLKPVGTPVWHKFPGEGGVTGMVLLSESHLACHTYPELGAATFNLYCCRERPEWPWSERLGESLGATDVTIRQLERAVTGVAAETGG
jgi:S-adenosylmethionine decarboxylase